MNKRQGEVAYASFSDGLQDDLPILILEVLSKFMKRSNKLRVNELFARSFEKDANINKYEFIIVTEKGRKIDITKTLEKISKLTHLVVLHLFEKIMN